MASPYVGIQKFIPPAALSMALALLDARKPMLRITKPRKTKLGDFSPHGPRGTAQITVNGDLNPYQFLVTLIHEVAHLDAFKQYGRNHKPHGIEWQTIFSNLLVPFVVHPEIFPEDLAQVLRNHIAAPRASSCSDPVLYKALQRYNKQHPNKNTVESLPMGAQFVLNRKLFEKGPRARLRYKCVEVTSGKFFMVHPLAEVIVYNPTKISPNSNPA
jgi:SprT protein